LLQFQERRHVWNADFHFERRGHSIECLDVLAGGLLSVLVEIDESGRDHESGNMDHTLARQCFRRNAGDLSIADSNIANRIESRLRVHYASALNHEVVLLGRDEGAAQQNAQQPKNAHREAPKSAMIAGSSTGSANLQRLPPT
jgi:hypothetical protein